MRLSVAALLVWAVCAGAAQAQGQTQAAPVDVPITEQVKDCDLLAAHPADPERMAEGVADDRIVPRLAIAACEQALREQPADPRFAFQLGRALLAYNKKADAAALFERAAKAGHGAAWAYLGDAFQFGHRGAPDYARAFEAYGFAVDKGFDRAKALLEMMVFDKDAFTTDLLDVAYAGNSAELTARSGAGDMKWPTRAYLYAFVQKIAGECDQAVAPTTVPPLFRYRFDSWSAETDASIAVEANGAAAEVDGQTFLRRHGCEGPVSRQLFANLNRFLKGY